jgi:hypothetical protein
MAMNINEDAMVALEQLETPEVMLPAQYYGAVAGPRRGDGARDLMLAVLEDGIRTFVTNRMGKTVRQRRLFEEVKHWIDARGDVSPFSFETICETFDIEPDALRRRMGSLSPEKFRRHMRTPKGSRMLKAA